MSPDSVLPVRTAPALPRSRWLSRTAGAVMAVSGVAGVVAVLVPGRDWAPDGGVHLTWRYPPVVGLWAVVILIMGCLIVVAPRRLSAAAAVGGLLALLLAGEGFVAVRDWFNVAGASGVALSSLADVVTIAAATCVCGLFAAVAGVYLAWPALWRSFPPRRGFLVAAVVVVGGIPLLALLLSGPPPHVTGAGAVLAAWSLPWACALVAAAYATRQASRYLMVAVIATGALAVVSALLGK